MAVSPAISPSSGVAALRDALGDRLQTDILLAPYTTFKIGGPADLFVEATTADELAAAVTAARASGVPYHLLGLGANVLVGDLGFRGLVIHNAARHVAVRGTQLWAESGAIVWPDLINVAVAAGLSGIEHYAGIPSTVGGALWQNLHFLSPDRSRTMFIEEVTEGAELLTEEGERRTVGLEYFDFGYDYSTLHVRRDVVLSATFRLTPADPEAMRAVIESNLDWRRERHPPLDTEPSAGSIFKKIEGIGAGRLIDGCGLKGFRVGGAEITQRHANIVINRGGATAADVRGLIAHVQAVVARETGYHLETEIGMIGEFAPPTEVA
jgi:UDP-N-acetylmuramate dehydrogenase